MVQLRVLPTSVHSAAMTSFFLPVFLTAATSAASSQLFMLDLSMTWVSGKRLVSCGQICPLNDLLSTAVKMVGMLNVLQASARPTQLLTSV